jgi:predicted DNA binding protein
MKITTTKIWRLIEAKCNAHEIAAYFGISETAARYEMMKAKKVMFQAVLE